MVSFQSRAALCYKHGTLTKPERTVNTTATSADARSEVLYCHVIPVPVPAECLILTAGICVSDIVDTSYVLNVLITLRTSKARSSLHMTQISDESNACGCLRLLNDFTWNGVDTRLLGMLNTGA